MPFLDEVDPLAAKIGAVNTVIRKREKLIGFNTDAEGFRAAIKEGMLKMERAGEGLVSTAVVYGYGGVTAVVVAVLKELGLKKIAITGRRLGMAEQRAEELGCGFFAMRSSNAENKKPFDLFVNAAPVSAQPLDQAENLLEALAGCRLVFDHEIMSEGVDYLKRYCEEKQVRHVSGFAMYWPQMLGQWQLFLRTLLEVEGAESCFSVEGSREKLADLVADEERLLTVLQEADKISQDGRVVDHVR